jgi:hypothetical protein
MTITNLDKFGADPVKIQWKVVRGDSASLRIEFLDDDEVTYYDTSDWTFSSTSYDSRGDILDELEVVASDGYVDIKASPDLTQFWGTGYKSTVAELMFDLQVVISGEEDITWTPVIGTISVLGDVTGTL